jgi:hypothetical protein
VLEKRVWRSRKWYIFYARARDFFRLPVFHLYNSYPSFLAALDTADTTLELIAPLITMKRQPPTSKRRLSQPTPVATLRRRMPRCDVQTQI